MSFVKHLGGPNIKDRSFRILQGVTILRDQGSLVTLLNEVSHACVQMAGELQHMQAALDRATLDEYHKLDPLGHGQELKSLQDHRAQRQQDFSNQFLSLLHQHETARHTNFLQVLS